MKKLQFTVSINAPVTKVYDFMLGIKSKSTPVPAKPALSADRLMLSG